MAWKVHYDANTGEIIDYYPTDKFDKIPEPAIDITDQEYVNTVFNQKLWRVNSETKTLQQVQPS